MKFLRTLLITVLSAAALAYLVHLFFPSENLEEPTASPLGEGVPLLNEEVAPEPAPLAASGPGFSPAEVRQITAPEKALEMLRQQMPVILGDLESISPVATPTEWQTLRKELQTWIAAQPEPKAQSAAAGSSALQTLDTVALAIKEREIHVKIFSDSQARHKVLMEQTTPVNIPEMQRQNTFLIEAIKKDWERKAQPFEVRMKNEVTILEKQIGEIGGVGG